MFDFHHHSFLGIDMGQKTCGIVKGNHDFILPIKNFKHLPNKHDELLTYLQKIVCTFSIRAIALGYPQLAQTNYPTTFIQRYIDNFYSQLRSRVSIPVVLVNEIDTTSFAKYFLNGPEQFLFRHDCDLYAAKLILERFLSRASPNNNIK